MLAMIWTTNFGFATQVVCTSGVWTGICVLQVFKFFKIYIYGGTVIKQFYLLKNSVTSYKFKNCLYRNQNSSSYLLLFLTAVYMIISQFQFQLKCQLIACAKSKTETERKLMGRPDRLTININLTATWNDDHLKDLLCIYTIYSYHIHI